MPEKRNETGSKESVISYVLLGAIALLGGVLILNQNHFDIQQYGQANLSTVQAGTSQEAAELAEFVPEGITQLGEPEVYTEENLYEKINGKAPMYIETGFVKLTSQLFALEENTEEIIEVSLYDMGKVRNAFSIFSTQRRVSSKPIEDLPFAYKTENAAYLVLGENYAEIVSYTGSQEGIDSVIFTANKMYNELGGDISEQLAELKILSTQELIPDTIQLNTNSAFGFTGFSNVFTGNFEMDGSKLTGFVIITEDLETASEQIESYKKFLLENGGSEISADEDIPNSFAVDLFGYTEIVFYYDNVICGVNQASDRESAVSLSEKLYNRLKSNYDKE
jgi:hypothetical protein